MLLDVPSGEGLHDHSFELIQRAKIGVQNVGLGIPADCGQIRHVRLRERHTDPRRCLEQALLNGPLGNGRQVLVCLREPFTTGKGHVSFGAK
ncbi:hypothetical protein D3C79_929250 [compost metagenome]